MLEAEREHPGPRLPSNGLVVYDVVRREYLASIDLGHPPGTMMPVGLDHVVTFHERPRPVCVPTGRVVHEWTDILGEQKVARSIDPPLYPLIALDPSGARFAVASAEAIDVTRLDRERLPR